MTVRPFSMRAPGQTFSLVSFASFLGKVAMAMPTTNHRALEYAARIIEEKAKSEVGTYQGAAGPFAAWKELSPGTKADRKRQGFPENEPLLRTGEMRDSIQHVVLKDEAQVGSNNDKAFWQEVGTSRISPRSFLGSAAVNSAQEIELVIGREIMLALYGEGLGPDRHDFW